MFITMEFIFDYEELIELCELTGHDFDFNY